jgi:deoxyribose-phosphate aldolase
MIEATLVRAHATQADIVEACETAIQHGFAAVSVNPVWVSFCARRLHETPVKVATVIGFPLGASTARAKLEEAREALQNGAGELDVVMNIGAVRSGFAKFAEREIAAIVATAGRVPVRVIVEACFLNRDEKVLAGQLCLHAGAAGVQTATGYGTAGATLEDVTLMREATRGRLVIKAAGGIRTYGNVKDFIAAGAGRIGTSAGADIIKDAAGA